MTRATREGPSAGRVILTVLEVGAILGGAVLGYRIIQNQDRILAAMQTPAAGTGGEPLPETEAPRLGDNLLPGTPLPESRSNGLSSWPDTPEKIAAMCGGSASDWQRNPEWPDSRTINNPKLGVTGYINREWRTANPDKWPTTPQEALDHFFPGQKIDPRFMQPAWIDPSTGQITGWHLSEDHWLVDGSPADVTLNLSACEVGEGYTVAGTLDPKDDRNWVAFGGQKDSISGGIAIKLAKGQGMTMWMPGTDPNAIALRMELFTAGDTPYYVGPNGEQLGPNAINFTPVYNAPGYDVLSRIFNGGYDAVVSQTFVESPTEILKKSLPLAGGTSPQTVRRPQDHGKSAVAFQRNPFKGIRGV